MVHSIPGILLLVAGLVGAMNIDARIAWILVAIAGVFMIVPL